MVFLEAVAPAGLDILPAQPFHTSFPFAHMKAPENHVYFFGLQASQYLMHLVDLKLPMFCEMLDIFVVL
jgi:hypothetical protein